MNLPKADRACAPCFVARVALIACVGIAVGFALRYFVVEPEAVARGCEGASAPRWCPLRLVLVEGVRLHAVGLIGMACGLFALLFQGSGPKSASAALCIGGAGLALQNPLTGAAAALMGMLALIRAR